MRSKPIAGGPTTTYQNAIAGRDVNSVGFDGTRVLWIDCVKDGGVCAVRKREQTIFTTTTTTIDVGGFGSSNLQWDSTSMYWGNGSHLAKFVH